MDLKKLFNGKSGDSGYIGEELLAGVDPVEMKCRVVRDCIRENIFTEKEALKAYGVSKRAYRSFIRNAR